MALALNGGVSLAVWMGGCAVELDCARRAGLAPEALPYPEFKPRPGGAETRGVYHALCTAFERKLVLDILTGASAGGVNGALLGAAMKAQRRLHPEFVRSKWIGLGDFADLLHETTEEEPRSLMQGDLFHDELVTAFEAILGTDPDNPGTAASALPTGQEGLEQEIPKLDVTMTDVIGRERVFRDEWDGDLVAREHRLRFKFRREEDYVEETLAAAARTSASFPVAFEPRHVEGDAAALAGLEEGESTYGIDGGVLDNAPIRAAIDLIPGQRASNQVRRFVCYLNADPPQATPEGVDGGEPTLKDVVGYVVNLPRSAPFVEQLQAVQKATRRADLTRWIQKPLLAMPQAALTDTAETLLAAYQRRRTALSLDELLEEPAKVAKAMTRLEDGDELRLLPWIPADLEPPGGPGGWDWGVRPAQRILHLLLDLLRPRIDAAPAGPELEAALDVREQIDDLIDALEARHSEMIGDGAILGVMEALASSEEPVEPLLQALYRLAQPYNTSAYTAVAEAYEAFAELPWDYAALAQPWDSLEGLLARTLGIEAVRRALAAEADVETAQTLRFVQLTPAAPTPILDPNPFEDGIGEPAKPTDKLLGIGLAHFAGFYRGAWRANDFMWGRLDAAARIVQILLDGVEAKDPAAAAIAAGTLAAAVLPADASETALWLVDEALEARLGEDYALAGDDVSDRDPLLAALKAAIEAELAQPADEGGEAEAERLALTRAVCIRAVQLEILQDELPVLVEQSAADREEGSSSPALELPLGAERQPAIETLRKRIEEGKTLPKQLDDKNEAVSELGLRTISHTVLVALSAAKTAGAPLSKLFGIVRAPVQAVSGVVSPDRLYRGTVAAAFWAAALYLTMRFATAEKGDTLLSDVWLNSVLLMLVAALTVLGVALVPGLRAARKVRPGRNWLLAGAVVALGGAAAGLLAYFAGCRSATNVVFGAGAEPLPDWVLYVVLGLTVGLGGLRLPAFASRVNAKVSARRRSLMLCLPVIGASALVAVLSIWRLAPLLDDAWWQILAAAIAIFVAPAFAARCLLPRRFPQ